MSNENKILSAEEVVARVAKQYQNQGLTLDELIEAGNKGVVLAAERYKPNKDYSFWNYAIWWVRQSILQALVEHSSGKSSPLSERERSIQQGINEGRPLADIATEWDLTERRVQQIYNRSILKTGNNE